jgi:hypothetical protein
MKTVIIWDECGQEDIQFVVVDGDYSELNGIYINNAHQEQDDRDRLSALIYAEDGEVIADFLKDFPVDAVKEGACVIVAGFLP